MSATFGMSKGEVGNEFDAVVVGGGFYGASIAAYLCQERGLERVLLVEREADLLARASYRNQARVHNGYHYPRSFTTAYRSRINLPRFAHDWNDAIKREAVSLYAIARSNSKITPRQFERFCSEIGASLRPVDAVTHALFEPRLIEQVFAVEEYVFDAVRLAECVKHRLNESGAWISLSTDATSIKRIGDGGLEVTLRPKAGHEHAVRSRYVFNCTYSHLNRMSGDFRGVRTRLKHEIAEIALIRAPVQLQGLGLTVVDGPFFSMLPFPARDLHSLTHVRYTPHDTWEDAIAVDPTDRLASYPRQTRYDRFVRDAMRFLPAMREAEYVESLYQVKTVLIKNEGDDGRPILIEKHVELPGCYSILGGKIDNVYDALEILDAENFHGLQPCPAAQG